MTDVAAVDVVVIAAAAAASSTGRWFRRPAGTVPVEVAVAAAVVIDSPSAVAG